MANRLRGRPLREALGFMLKRHRVRIHDPVKRLKSNWRHLSNAELRLLMSGIAEWESRTPLGPTHTRLRRRRRDAVFFYRKYHGKLGDDRLWAIIRVKPSREAMKAWGRHDPKREHARGVLWHET